jgi:hypothetical protein
VFLEAMASHLQAAHGLRVLGLRETDRPGIFTGTVQRDHELAGETLGPLKGVKVGMPHPIVLGLEQDGGVRVLEQGEPGASPDEVETFARTLDTQGAIAEGASEEPGTTHAVKVDEDGNRRLVRRRFSIR